MVRAVFRATKVLLSLFSTMLLLAAPSPTGGPSLLERVPLLMEALGARVAAQDSGPPIMPPGPSGTSAADAAPLPDHWTPPPEEVAPAEPPGPKPSRLPPGTDRIRVNRGLP